jgi:hypothetical protein
MDFQFEICEKKGEGRRKKEEGRGKKEEGRRNKTRVCGIKILTSVSTSIYKTCVFGGGE